MAIAKVQTAPQTLATGGAAASSTFGSTPVAGNLIVVGVMMRRTDANAEGVTVADNKGNTYHAAAVATTNNGNKAAIYYAFNIGSSPTFTVTATPVVGGNQQTAIAPVEWSGFGTADPLVGASTNVGLNKNPTTGSTGDTASPEAAVVAVMATMSFTFSVTGITVETVVPAWTDDYTIVNGAFNALCGDLDSRIVSGSGTQSCSWTLSVGGAGPNWSAAIAAFYGNPAAADTNLTQLSRQVLELDSNASINLTQFSRQVLYPFTCSPTPPPPRGLTGCPADLPTPVIDGADGCDPDLE